MLRFWKQAGASCISALVVVGAFLWLHRDRPAPAPPATCLDRVIGEVEIDLRTLESALASLEKATGIRFEIDRAEIRPGYEGYGPKKMRFRQVTVKKALECILRQFDGMWNWRAEGEAVRIGSELPPDEPQQLRIYDVRDLVELSKQFAGDFETQTGLSAARPGGVALPSSTGGSFSSVPGGGISRAGGLFGPRAAVTGQADFIRAIVADTPEIQCDAGGWLLVHGTAAEHDKLRRILEFLRTLR